MADSGSKYIPSYYGGKYPEFFPADTVNLSTKITKDISHNLKYLKKYDISYYYIAYRKGLNKSKLHKAAYYFHGYSEDGSNSISWGESPRGFTLIRTDFKEIVYLFKGIYFSGRKDFLVPCKLYIVGFSNSTNSHHVITELKIEVE